MVQTFSLSVVPLNSSLSVCFHFPSTGGRLPSHAGTDGAGGTDARIEVTSRSAGPMAPMDTQLTRSLSKCGASLRSPALRELEHPPANGRTISVSPLGGTGFAADTHGQIPARIQPRPRRHRILTRVANSHRHLQVVPQVPPPHRRLQGRHCIGGPQAASKRSTGYRDVRSSNLRCRLRISGHVRTENHPALRYDPHVLRIHRRLSPGAPPATTLSTRNDCSAFGLPVKIKISFTFDGFSA